MGLVDKIKSDVKRSGSNKGKFTYIRDGQKVRVRFLTDMDDGMEVTFHDSFEQGVNVPCQELFGRDCPYCEREGLRTRSLYAWSVYNYESKQVEVFMFAVNNCSPIPALMAMYENYGTLLDRDFVISVSGKQTNKTYSVVPMDKVKFRNEKAKAFSEKAILKMIDKAWPADDIEFEDDEDDDEDERPAKKKNNSSKMKAKAKAKPEPDEDDDDDWDEEDDDETLDYSEMTPKELFKLCKERELDALPKKNAKYYINILKEADKAEDDWGDDEDEDEWEDE